MLEINEKIADLCIAIHRTAEKNFGKANIALSQYVRLRHELFLDTLRRLVESWLNAHSEAFEKLSRLENESD